jgi:DNA polymerase-3 subunit gamma/tau
VAEPVPETSSAASVAAGSDSGDWHALVGRLSLAGMAKQLAQHCELAELGDAAIRLRLPPAHKHLLVKAAQDKLEAELSGHYGRALKLVVDVAATASETPAERTKNEKRERQEKAIAAIEQDPFVRDVIDLFDASIDESTIKPV